MYVCVGECVLSHFDPVQLFATLWAVALQAPLSTGFHRQEYCDALLQGILPTQGLKPHLLHCRWILYRLATEGTNLYIKVFF